jgi:protein phosphatase
MEYEYAVISDTGKRRSKNEDAYYINEKHGLFVLADGLGGHAAGEVASRIAVETIGRHITENIPRGRYISQSLKEAVVTANKSIYQMARVDPKLEGMATTVVAALIRPGILYLAHVGDSRAYLLTKSGLMRLTMDHTLVSQMVSEGRITEQEAVLHPHRNVLVRCLGIEENIEVDVQKRRFSYETLLLCTDGLTEMLNDGEVEDILQHNLSCQSACEILVAAANQRGGIDNVTVILVKRKGRQVAAR